MAAQYSNRHFFRKTPNQYLGLYFHTKGIQLEVDCSQLKENDANALQAALNKLPDNQIADIEAEFQDVNALACEGGIVALVDEASFHHDTAFIEEIAAIEGFHAKAMWAFEIIFVYSETEGSLDIYAPKNSRAITDLQAIFAKSILKLETLPGGGIDNRVYDLTPVVEDDFEFQIEPASTIDRVLFISISHFIFSNMGECRFNQIRIKALFIQSSDGQRTQAMRYKFLSKPHTFKGSICLTWVLVNGLVVLAILEVPFLDVL